MTTTTKTMVRVRVRVVAGPRPPPDEDVVAVVENGDGDGGGGVAVGRRRTRVIDGRRRLWRFEGVMGKIKREREMETERGRWRTSRWRNRIRTIDYFIVFEIRKLVCLLQIEAK